MSAPPPLPVNTSNTRASIMAGNNHNNTTNPTSPSSAAASNSKRCAVANCANIRMGGKSYCFVHRLDQTQHAEYGGNATPTTSNTTVPASGAATPVTSPPPPMPKQSSTGVGVTPPPLPPQFKHHPPPPPSMPQSTPPPPLPAAVAPVELSPTPPPRKLSFGQRMSVFASSLTGNKENKGPPPPPVPTLATSTRSPPPLPGQPSSASTTSSSSSLFSTSLTRSFAPSITASRSASSTRYTISQSNPFGGVGGTLDTSNLMIPLEFHHLLHIPDQVSAQVETGLYLIHRVIAVLKRILSHEEEFYRNLIKSVGHESAKVERLARDAASRSVTVWNNYQNLTMEHANCMLEYNAKLTYHSLVPLLEFHNAAVVKKKELDKEIALKEKEVHTFRVNTNKEQNHCEKLIATWKVMKDEENGGMTNGSGGNNHGSSNITSLPDSRSSSSSATKLFSKFTSKFNTFSFTFANSTAVQEKLIGATQKYNEVLIQANRRMEIFHSHELPHYLTELQKIESQRLEMMNESMKKWSELCMERTETIATKFFCKTFPSNAAQLDPAADLDEIINSFIDVHETEHSIDEAPITIQECSTCIDEVLQHGPDVRESNGITNEGCQACSSTVL